MHLLTSCMVHARKQPWDQLCYNTTSEVVYSDRDNDSGIQTMPLTCDAQFTSTR